MSLLPDDIGCFCIDGPFGRCSVVRADECRFRGSGRDKVVTVALFVRRPHLPRTDVALDFFSKWYTFK